MIVNPVYRRHVTALIWLTTSPFWATGCWNLPIIPVFNDPEPPKYLAPLIAATQASALIDQADPNVAILDVRLPGQFIPDHIEGAVNMCLLCSIDFKKDLSALDKTKIYIVYGSAGDTRSARATDMMVELQFEDVRHMNGGIEEWKAAGYPTVLN